MGSILNATANSSFDDQVYELVSQIPKGRVTTYGTIAALCGKPHAARIVGGIAHFGPSELPWQRVVKAGGRLAEGFPGGVDGHRQVLEAEGVEVRNHKVANFKQIYWDGRDV